MVNIQSELENSGVAELWEPIESWELKPIYNKSEKANFCK